MTTVYLVRHAEALGNINQTFQGRTDLGITENGYRQLDSLAERFKNIPLEVIYSSPMIRTIETAKAVNRHHNLDIIELDGIIEINGGPFEGVSWAELPEKFPKAYDLWANKHYAFEIEGGESMKAVYDRMKAAITDIVRSNLGKTIAVISHGCAIRNFLCYADSIPFEELDSIGWSENTAVCKLQFEVIKPKVIYKNDATHLSGADATLAHQSWWKK